MAKDIESQGNATWAVGVASAALTMAVVVTAASALGWLRPPGPPPSATPREAPAPASPNQGRAPDPPGSEVVLVPVAPTGFPGTPTTLEPGLGGDEVLLAEADEPPARSWEDDDGEHHHRREHHGEHEEHDDDD